MKTFTIMQPKQVELIEVPKPVPAPDEAIIRVAYTGLCATDLAIHSGDMSLVRNGSIKYPVRFGHEWSGVIESVGSEVKDFKPGDRVISECSVTCGVCEACQKQDWANCTDHKSLGTINCWDGSFAEYMHVPVRHLYKIPECISLPEAALVEPTCISYVGVKAANVTPDKTVLVVGTGAIGLAAVGLAKHFGAKKIFLCGRKNGKLEIGKQMGADVLINTTKDDTEAIIKEHTGGKGVDVVIETSGNVSVIPQCMCLAAKKGDVSLVGFYEQEVPSFPIDEIVMKSLHVHGVMGQLGTPKAVLRILEEGNMQLKPIISHILPFAQTKDVMENIEQYNETRTKILFAVSDK